MKKELNEKQKMFCLEYLKSFNATDAYKKVYGVSQKSAESQGCRMLSNVKVAEYLQSKAQQKTEKLDVGVDYVLAGLKEITEIGMGKKAVMKDGEEKYILDLSNANSAYEKLGKYNKMFTDKVEQSGTLNIEVISYKDYPDD